MSGGGYRGGSTIIGPGSSWFSRGRTPAKATTEKVTLQSRQARPVDQTTLASNRKSARKAKAQIRHAALLEAQAAKKNNPVYLAAQAKRKAARTQKKIQVADENRQAIISAKNIEVVVREKGKERIIRVGVALRPLGKRR